VAPPVDLQGRGAGRKRRSSGRPVPAPLPVREDSHAAAGAPMAPGKGRRLRYEVQPGNGSCRTL